MYRTLLVFILCLELIGCGGNASSPSSAAAPAPIPTTSGGTGTTSPAGSPSIVQVSARNTAAGVNIVVVAPNGTQPNIQDLGVAQMTGSASAFNTGDVIHRGSTARVVLFGPGLSSSMTVAILGPNDVQVGNVTDITADDGTPGVAFTATVAGNAALGARTVALQSTNGNMTTFTGGIEVVQ